MFLRKKQVGGNAYWYLVESHRENGKVRQRVVRYIGNDERLEAYLAEEES